MHLPLLCTLGLVACTALGSVAGPEDLRLIPFPKQVRLSQGEFLLTRPLTLQAPAQQAETAGLLLNEELQRAGLPKVRVRALTSTNAMFRLSVSGTETEAPAVEPFDADEAYVLEVREDEVVCTARHSAGVHYGLQTLCQLIRANRRENALPRLTISDWPSLRWRCFQDDMTRGPSSKLDTLKFEAALGSYLKLNLMTFYMEYQYAFKKHPNIGPTNGSLTAEDLSALVEYVKPLHLDVLGNQQSFGHFGQILKHPEYASLRETPDVLTPVREETYRLLDDLYSEVCPLVPFPWFNVCCDETWGLGEGPSRDLAAQIGVGGVYVRHIARVHDLLKKNGKRMMMWGDIILQHPGELNKIPQDTIMLTWGYDARQSFEDQIVPFAKSGYEFFVCPGVNNWSRILPDFGVAVTNIQNFVRDGAKHGALGMLNTDWEDDGEAINAVKWHADAWAAECAWNASKTPIEGFNRRVGAVLFGESGNHFGQAVELLAKTHRMPAMKGMMNARFWENDFLPRAKPVRVEQTASELLAAVKPALQHLEACFAEARCNRPILDALIFGARRMELIGQRMLDGLKVSRLYEQACQSPQSADALAEVEQLIRKNREAHEALGRRFASLWLAESKPYALDWTLRRYTNAVATYDALLTRVVAARADARAGRRLPAPEEVGLALPRPLARLLRPSEILATPLAPGLPWADPTATHRVGIKVQAGAADRYHLPVEVEISVPPGLAGQPMRAFVLNPKGAREVLAQFDAVADSGKGRLVVVLDKPLATGEAADLYAYFGGTGRSPGLAGAVATRAESTGRQWLENDQVRALLGSEGAHVYRWEVKAAGKRDLTMPGEADWAGFSDINSNRRAPYELVCTAHGPALVEFQCTDATGHGKTIRLFGGASWLEVFLDEPTSIYWDFDNPGNFAADGPTPGTWLFSNGQSGAVGREADGVPAQVEAPNTHWGIKFNEDKLALGLITPETPALHHVAPGAGAGGVGIESSPPAQHFITFAGMLQAAPAEVMNRLQQTLDLKRPISVRLFAWESK